MAHGGDGITLGIAAKLNPNTAHGFPMIGAEIDGLHVLYHPNSPEEALNCKSYKMWTSLLNIAVVNSYYCFVNLDVGWPGRFHDKTRTENSNFWNAMNLERDVAWQKRSCACRQRLGRTLAERH